MITGWVAITLHLLARKNVIYLGDTSAAKASLRSSTVRATRERNRYGYARKKPILIFTNIDFLVIFASYCLTCPCLCFLRETRVSGGQKNNRGQKRQSRSFSTNIPLHDKQDVSSWPQWSHCIVTIIAKSWYHHLAKLWACKKGV